MTRDAFPVADLRRCFGSPADLISCYNETATESHQGRERQWAIKEQTGASF